MSTLSAPGGSLDLVEHVAASRSVDSNFVPAGARKRSWNCLDAARREDLASERRRRRPTTIADRDARTYAATSRPRAGARRWSSAAEAMPQPVDPVVGVRFCAGRRVRAPSSHTDEHRHERAREQERRDHREADRERQRHEERSRDAGHEERRHEDRDDRQHREQSRHDHFAAGVEHAARDRRAARQVRVDVLDRDRRFVDEDADGQRQAAERHDVDRLAGAPQRDDRGEQRERNRDDDDRGAAPVAQEHAAPSARSAARRAPPRAARPASAPDTFVDWSSS